MEDVIEISPESNNYSHSIDNNDEEEDIEDQVGFGLVDKHVDTSKYRLVKRVPFHEQGTENELFINRTQKLELLHKRCLTLLESGRFEEIVLHGLGAAVGHVVKLALLLKDGSNGRLSLGCTTSTVSIVDDFVPLQPDLLPISRVRNNSAIHIRVILAQDSLFHPNNVQSALGKTEAKDSGWARSKKRRKK